MKYIIFGTLREYHIFPNYRSHKVVANRLGGKPTSAGFVKIEDGDFVVFGESQSLGLKSKQEDNEILNLEEM